MLAEDLSRDVAPEKFRSKAKSVGGFVFGQLGDVFLVAIPGDTHTHKLDARLESLMKLSFERKHEETKTM